MGGSGACRRRRRVCRRWFEERVRELEVDGSGLEVRSPSLRKKSRGLGVDRHGFGIDSLKEILFTLRRRRDGSSFGVHLRELGAPSTSVGVTPACGVARVTKSTAAILDEIGR